MRVVQSDDHSSLAKVGYGLVWSSVLCTRYIHTPIAP